MEITTLRDKLAAIDQHQVLRFYDHLDDGSKEQLRRQLAGLDLGEIDELAEKHVRHKSAIAIPARIEPVKSFPRRPTGDFIQKYADTKNIGLSLLKEGKVAAFLVAG